MFQDCDVSSLKELFNLWLNNRETLFGLESGLSGVFARYSSLAMTWLGRYNPYMSKRHVVSFPANGFRISVAVC